MHIHILGICGTFMGGIAQIASALGHRVTGSDLNVYPPMSDHLKSAGIDIQIGYEISHLQPAPDLVLIGNALSRGNPAIEYLLTEKIPYRSAPQWLAETVLAERQVIAIAGTHGKTTTTSMLTWILEANGLKPGYLIGGLATNFPLTAALGEGEVFVIEADEYDTAFFDKRSKFVHYGADIFVINNLEYDHADIFPDLAAIQRQFHHGLRTVPATGQIICLAKDENIEHTIEMGCWTPVNTFGFDNDANWQITKSTIRDGTGYSIRCPAGERYEFPAPSPGDHNALNALAAIVAANYVGVSVSDSIAALAQFKGVKRRLENFATVADIALFDDFAHHPTAVAATLKAMRSSASQGTLHCVLEPRSNTMQLGIHQQPLVAALDGADRVYIYDNRSLKWNISDLCAAIGENCVVCDAVDSLVEEICRHAQKGDQIVVMSNGGFEGIHQKLENSLRLKFKDSAS